MDTDKIKYILSLYEDGIITHTAQKNFITQPSLTKVIKGWEKEYNCTLLLRSKKGVTFTEEGELFVKFCRDFLALQDSFKDALATAQNKLAGHLTLGSSLNYTRYLLPNFLQIFTQKHPLINISLTTAHSEKLYDALVNKKIDVAILRGDFQWLGPRYLLTSEPMCLVSTKPLAQKNLSGKNYIGHKSDFDIQFKIDKWSFENKVNIADAKMLIGDINTCAALVQTGAGWSILPKICLKDFKGYVKPLYFQDKTPVVRNTFVLVSETKASLPVVKAFIKELLAYHHIKVK